MTNESTFPGCRYCYRSSSILAKPEVLVWIVIWRKTRSGNVWRARGRLVARWLRL
jgi:hypothetical protein